MAYWWALFPTHNHSFCHNFRQLAGSCLFLVPNHTIGLSTLAMLQKDFNRERSSHLHTQLNELRYKRHQKRATYFATMPKNELKSKVACFTCQLQVA